MKSLVIRHFVWLLGAVLLSAVAVVDADDTVRVAVISDLNGSQGSTTYSSRVKAAVKRIIELRPDLVICTGDMVAGQRRNPPLSPQEMNLMWAAFNKAVFKPLAKAGIPLAVTPGSQDVTPAEAFDSEREAFERQWRTRRPDLDFVDRKDYPYRYAFSVGTVLFLAIESTVPSALPPGTLDWLQKTLVEYGDSYSHRILFTHLSLWPISQGLEAEVSGDRELEAILQFHNVSAMLTGHNHAFYPCERDGLLLLSQGSLGIGTRRLVGSDAATPNSFTMVEIDNDGIRFRALVAPAYSTAVDLEQLPEKLSSPDVTLIRADLAAATH